MTRPQAPINRTREIEEVSNLFFIHPISRQFARLFARLHVHPNAVSILGMVLGGAAAVAYYQYERWPMALLGFVLMVGWHIMDGADGQLARLTGKTSEIGKVLDGLCDHVAFTLVYGSLALALTPVWGVWIWVLAALAGASHIAQASAYEYQRQAYDHWVQSKKSARIVTLEELRAQVDNKHSLARLFGKINVAYLNIQRRFAAMDEELQRELTTALIDDGLSAPRIRNAYRGFQQSAVKKWTILCSNYRTLAIFLACLAGNPVYFFLYEILVLNGALMLLIRIQKRRNRALRAWLVANVYVPSGSSSPAAEAASSS